MRSTRGLWLAVLALCAPAISYADAPPGAAALPKPGRVVIRGSGSDVRLERETTPPPTRKRFDAGPPALLQDVARMTKDGVGDPVVIAYLKEHARALPKVLGQDDLAWLQAHGVREPVIAFLTRRIAVDIGVTGEGREGSAVYAAPVPEIDMSDMGLEYPMDGYVSYGGGHLPAPRRFLARHVVPRRHGFISPRPMTVPPRPGHVPQNTTGTLYPVPHRPADGF